MAALHGEEAGVVVDRIREKDCGSPISAITTRRFKTTQRNVAVHAPGVTEAAVRERDARRRYCISPYIRHRQEFEDSLPYGHRRRYMCVLTKLITQTPDQKRVGTVRGQRESNRDIRHHCD